MFLLYILYISCMAESEKYQAWFCPLVTIVKHFHSLTYTLSVQILLGFINYLPIKCQRCCKDDGAIIGDTRHVSHGVSLVRIQPGLSLGWHGSHPWSESRQNVGGSPLSLAVKQPLWQPSSATDEPQGAYRDREPAELPLPYRDARDTHSHHRCSPPVKISLVALHIPVICSTWSSSVHCELGYPSG